MIAANYRKHPDAMALQWPLPLGLPRWILPRPGSRVLRAIRAARGKAFQLAGRIRRPQPAKNPEWFTAARRRARELAKAVRAACLPVFAEPEARPIRTERGWSCTRGILVPFTYPAPY